MKKIVSVLFLMQLLPLLVFSDQLVKDWSKQMYQLQQKYSENSGEIVTSSIKKGRQSFELLKVDVSGFNELYLSVKGVPNYNFCHSIWGEGVLTKVTGEQVKLVDLIPTKETVGWDKLRKNKGVDNKPLNIAGQKMEHGFLAHANSLIVFSLKNEFKSFEVKVGIGNTAGSHGSGQFMVSSESQIKLEKAVARIDADFPTFSNLTQSLGNLWFLDHKKAEGIKNEQFVALPKTLANTIKGSGIEALATAELQKSRFETAIKELRYVNRDALLRALNDLSRRYRSVYKDAKQLKKQFDSVNISKLNAGLANFDLESLRSVENLLRSQREMLLRNPALDFDKILFIKRSRKYLGLAANFKGNAALRQLGNRDEIMLLDYKKSGQVETVFKPKRGELITDIELDYSANKILFSMPSTHGSWQLFERSLVDGTQRQLTKDESYCIHNYDSCYLPNGKIIYTSTAPQIGVPCVNGTVQVASNYLLDPIKGITRQLCFDQDHNWDPTVMNDGKVLYQRWEYADMVHSNNRLLFTMNPDGTNQRSIYGSNSYWPTSFFGSRVIPNSSSKIIGIATGHHGIPRFGELILLDTRKGNKEADGVIQRIPGYGKKVEPVVADKLADKSWPRFIHPYPINDKYFLVTGQLAAGEKIGLYLVDVWDNMLLLKNFSNSVPFEPIPFRKRKRPPVIPDRVNLEKDTSTVYLQNVYLGPGLEGIPVGTVKKLRVFSYYFANHGQGGLFGTLGIDGPWDMRRILGEVSVYEDGSAMFTVPSNTPISIQPLDKDGKALQLFRSWFTAMPGEVLSCVGCHEDNNSTPPVRTSIAAGKAPSQLEPWNKRITGFSYENDVQPVLDQYCIGCHNGTSKTNGKPTFDLKGGTMVSDYKVSHSGNGMWGGRAGQYTTSYANLFPFVRGPGIESPMAVLTPMEFHADATDLIQKGHYNVDVDKDSMRKVIAWIDLNTPFHGDRSSRLDKRNGGKKEKIRAELRKRYGNIDLNYEAEPEVVAQHSFEAPKPVVYPVEGNLELKDWPKLVKVIAGVKEVDLGGGVKITLRRITKGDFVMGSKSGQIDEMPRHVVSLKKDYWISESEITNAQFRRIFPKHNSGEEDRIGYQFGVRCYDCNEENQPAIRLSWIESMAFCKKLSEMSGLKVNLPTESQWEYACRAGSNQSFSYGGLDADFSMFENFSDKKSEEFATYPYSRPNKIVTTKNPTKYEAFNPADKRFNDGALIGVTVKSFKPNAWGLYDMHGNVAEWTRSRYKPYPYTDEINPLSLKGKRVVRGGSWRDRPKNSTSSFRKAYHPYHKVFNVGFRVIIED